MLEETGYYEAGSGVSLGQYADPQPCCSDTERGPVPVHRAAAHQAGGDRILRRSDLDPVFYRICNLLFRYWTRPWSGTPSSCTPSWRRPDTTRSDPEPDFYVLWFCNPAVQILNEALVRYTEQLHTKLEETGYYETPSTHLVTDEVGNNTSQLRKQLIKLTFSPTLFLYKTFILLRLAKNQKTIK